MRALVVTAIMAAAGAAAFPTATPAAAAAQAQAHQHQDEVGAVTFPVAGAVYSPHIYTFVFGVGAALAGLAGLMQAAILTAQIGMGENILILAFVVIIIGGIGSVKGALVGAILVGVTDTLGRVFLPQLFGLFLPPSEATSVGASLAAMAIYLLMAGVLAFRPQGLFPVNA